MRDANARSKYLEHVTVTVLKKLISRIITRKAHRHASSGKLLHPSNASPRRRRFARWITILKPLVNELEAKQR